MTTETEQVDKQIPLREADDGPPIAYFREVSDAFLRAEEAAGGPIDRFYDIGGYIIRLRFAGPGLVPYITPALAHLAAEPASAPALTIWLWDSVSTHTEMPPPWWSDDNISRRDTRAYYTQRVRTAFQLGSNILSMLDHTLDRAIFWIRDARKTPYYETGAPLQTILYWWMRGHGRQFTHAAAIGTPTGGVLLAGKSGSGKSTTALACLHSSLGYTGDDYCLLATDDDPYVFSLYSTGKLDPDNVHRFPDLAPLIKNRDRLDSEKALFFLHEHYPEEIATGFPVRAVLLPKVTGRPETGLTVTSPAAGLKALAPSTLFQLAGAGREDFQAMAELVKRVPCYVLHVGTELSGIPGAIRSLLSGSDLE